MFYGLQRNGCLPLSWAERRMAWPQPSWAGDLQWAGPETVGGFIKPARSDQTLGHCTCYAASATDHAWPLICFSI